MEHKRKLRREGEKLRREKLNQRIKELAEAVPWLPKSEQRPEKTRILKLAASYLRFHHGLKKKMLMKALPPWLQDEISHFSLEKQITDGFLLVVSRGGNIIYVSETVSEVLGHSQLDLIGSSIYSLIHEDDKILFDNQFTNNNSKFYITQECEKDDSAKGFPPVLHSDHNERKSFCVRMESINEHGDSQQYETIQISGRVSFIDSANQNPSKAAITKNTWLVAVGRRVKSEVSLENSVSMSPIRNSNEWITQHGLDAKLWYQDQRVATILGVLARDHIGTSVYQHTCICKEDLKYVAISHMKIMTDLESPSTIFRLQNIFDEFEYVESRSIIVNDAWTKRPLFIISLNCLLEKVDGAGRLKIQAEMYNSLINSTQNLSIEDSGSEDSQTENCDKRHVDEISETKLVEVSPSPSNISTVSEENPSMDTFRAKENETLGESNTTKSNDSVSGQSSFCGRLPMLKSLLREDPPICCGLSEENVVKNNVPVNFPLVKDDVEREEELTASSQAKSSDSRNKILHKLLMEEDDKGDVHENKSSTHGRDKLLQSVLFHENSENPPKVQLPHIDPNHFYSQISKYFSVPPSVHKNESTHISENKTSMDCSEIDDNAQNKNGSSANKQGIIDSELQETNQGQVQETRTNSQEAHHNSQRIHFNSQEAHHNSQRVHFNSQETHCNSMETRLNSENNVTELPENMQDKKTWHVTMALHKQLRQKFTVLQHNMQEQHREINELQHKLTESTMHVSEHNSTDSTDRRSQILQKINSVQHELYSQRKSLLSLQEEANEKYRDLVSMTTTTDVTMTTEADVSMATGQAIEQEVKY